MVRLSFRYLFKNKRQSLTLVIGVVLASILLFSVGILFSSFRDYLIGKALEENNYHVKIKGQIDFDDNIISLKEEYNTYFIKFKDVTKTYEYTDKLCHTNLCNEVYYNNKLLSLYGTGDDNYLELFKSLIIGIVFILAVSVFFIIYNCFQMVLTKKKKDIFLLSSLGATKGQTRKVFFLKEIICGFIGIILGLFFSIFFNAFVLKIINDILFEYFNGDLRFSLYLPFLWIPFIFLLIIVIFSSLFSLFKMRKYMVMDIYRDDDIDREVKGKIHKNFILSYAITNYERSKKKYRGGVICIFIFVLLLNSFMSFTSYMFRIFDDYVDLPKYDIALISSMDDYERLSDFSNFLKASKKVIFKACEQTVLIPKEFYNGNYQKTSNLFITNLGENKLINRVDSTTLKGDKMYRNFYSPFNNLKDIKIGNYKIEVSLTSKVPLGFENMLSEGSYVLNLSDNDFNLVCPKYEGRAFIWTDEKGLDDKVLDYALKNDFDDLSYVNVKKGYEFINNFILVLRLFMGLGLLIIAFIFVFGIFNVISANIVIRKREFATIKSLGLTNTGISLCLGLESLIISFKGLFYAFPFILLISRYLYVNLDRFFEIDLVFMNYKVFILSFLMSFLLVFGCMILSHLRLYRNSLIYNIKDDKF